MRNPQQLAELFKQGGLDDKKAFIAPTREDVPNGYSSVRLPFHDDALVDGDELPAVFIAPVGFKVPDGYRGHPLPYDPKTVPNSVTVIHKKDDEKEEFKPTPANGLVVKDKIRANKNSNKAR